MPALFYEGSVRQRVEETDVAATAQRLWGVVEPYVAAEGVELDDIEILGGGRVVRVVVDGPQPLAVDRIADLSRGISRLIDEVDPMSATYTLEVTSPGLERKLRTPRHFEKAVGRDVTVKTRTPVDEATHRRGILAASDDEGFVLDIDGEQRRLAYDDVASARTIFVWERGGRPGKDS